MASRRTRKLKPQVTLLITYLISVTIFKNAYFSLTHCYLYTETTAGKSQMSSQQQTVDAPVSGRYTTGESLQQQASPGSHARRGRRPSLSEIANIQKQHTIDDDSFEDRTALMSPEKKSSRWSQDDEYEDTLGLFSGLRQDYAWCDGQ